MRRPFAVSTFVLLAGGCSEQPPSCPEGSSRQGDNVANDTLACPRSSRPYWIALKPTPELGGFAIHVPYPALSVTFTIDMNGLAFEIERPMEAWVLKKNELGVATRYDSVRANSIGRIWFRSAADMPSDSNLELSWGD